MKTILANDTIQIEITNFCPNNCANCTRFVKHCKKPFFMDFQSFKDAVDSMEGFPRMTGVMGGEPLSHPDFVEYCQYLHKKIPPRQCGLWTCLPPGKEKYREVICETFGHIFINDHTREDIMHHPLLVSAREVTSCEDWLKWVLIDQCWAQTSWSASINPNGAFFCEIAASLSILLKIKEGWKVEPGWWHRTPKDYTRQMESFCMLCGGAMPLKKRVSTTVKDEISPLMVERLRPFSLKVARDEFIISDCLFAQDDSTMASYKDENYRDKIAARYGMYLTHNDQCFLTPHLSKSWKGGEK